MFFLILKMRFSLAGCKASRRSSYAFERLQHDNLKHDQTAAVPNHKWKYMKISVFAVNVNLKNYVWAIWIEVLQMPQNDRSRLTEVHLTLELIEAVLTFININVK